MTETEFLSEFAELLQTDADLGPDTALSGMEEWDSLAFMAVIAFFVKRFDINLTFDDLFGCATPRDVMALAGKNIS